MLKDVEDWKWRSNYSWKSIKCVSCDKNPRAINVTSKRNKTWHHAPSVTYFAIKMNSCFNHFFLLVNCIHKLHKKLLAYISSVIKNTGTRTIELLIAKKKTSMKIMLCWLDTNKCSDQGVLSVTLMLEVNREGEGT